MYLMRVEDQLAWFGIKSVQLGRRYRLLLVLSVVLAGMTPLLILVSELPKIVQALPAALASMISGTIAIYGYPEQIAAFGRTLDEIRSQKFRFMSRVAPYDGNDAFPRFVERVELAITSGSAQGRQAWLKGASGVAQGQDASGADSR